MNPNDFPVLTAVQWRFVAARLVARSDREAAEAIGIHPTTAAAWPNKREINDLLEHIAKDATRAAVALLGQRALEAATTVLESMNSEDAAVRLRAAQDVLDRTLGRAVQRNELRGALAIQDDHDNLSDDELQRRLFILAQGAVSIPLPGDAALAEDEDSEG